MKFLIDNALSPQVALALNEAGYDAVHVRDMAMADAADIALFKLASTENRIIVSADTDFGTLLVLHNTSKPSFVLFRRENRTPAGQISLLKQFLPQFESELEQGCILVFDDERIRIRQLPIGGH